MTPPFTFVRPPRILLCSAWQTVNIGDIAHTPGALALLEKYFPDAEVTLWTFNPLTPAVRELLRARFPHVSILETKLDADGRTNDPAVLAAIDRADFFLHGSGPAMLGWRHAELFAQRTRRGFGVLGVTYGLYGIPERDTLSRARFVLFRDSISLARAKNEGVRPHAIGWAPDTAFCFDIFDDTRAAAWLSAHGLEDGKFLCCISRYRNTPFWLMRGKDVPFDATRHARNEEKKEQDHAPLLEAITRIVRETGMKILLCPEDESQIAITREMLLEWLPSDVRANVVWRDTFWTPQEALGVYRRSAGLFGHEQHSPIMCIAHGIPAIVCRWAEQSSKGEMWRDIGLGDWLFDLDNPADCARVAPAVLAIARDSHAAREKAAAAHEHVRASHAKAMAVLACELSAAIAANP